jgi:transcriptional regulator with XRE-family HTH domain
MSRLNANIASKRVKELIDQKCGGSQQEFANMIGASKNSVSQWVNGVSAPGNLSAAKISRVFGVEPLWVMGESDQKFKSNVTQASMLTEHEQLMLLKYRSLLSVHRKLIDDMIQSLVESTQSGEAVIFPKDVLSDD